MTSPQTTLSNVAATSQTYEYKYRQTDSYYYYYDRWVTSTQQWANQTMIWGANNKSNAIKVGKTQGHADYQTWFDVETASTNYMLPHTVSANGANIELKDTNSNVFYAFVDPYGQTGPTVTSITRNESNELITVLHTGTLTSADVNHTISNVSSSITNLQTVSNGSTFTASGNNGTHVISIGDELISYYINNAAGRVLMSSNNNLTVSFPTTDSAWLSNFSAYDSGTLTFISYLDTKTAIRLAVDSNYNYFIWIIFNTSYNSTQGGFSVLTKIYDYTNSTAANNWAFAYGSTLQWVYPEATFESTGSANTLITLPSNDIVDSFNWNFASVVAQAETTSNGGGKPRRYPIISTNLFDRQRSIFSIGMTHKDETLF